MSDKNQNYDEELFRYIFNHKFFPQDYGYDFDFVDRDLFKLIGDAESYDVARNRIVAKAVKDGNYDFLKKAIFAYDQENPKEEATERRLPSLENLEKTLRDVNPESMNADDNNDYSILGRTSSIAKALGYDGPDGSARLIKEVFGGNPSVDEMDNFYLKRLEKTIADNLKSREAKRNFYRELGYTPSNDRNYANSHMAKILERAGMIVANQEANEAAKTAFEIAMPNNARSAAEGRGGAVRFANDLFFDIAPIYPATKVAKGEGAMQKLTELGIPSENLAVKSGIGALLGSAFTSGHNLIDSLATKHVYSEGEGEDKDISKRGDWKGALASGLALPVLINSGLGILTGFAGGKKMYDRAFNSEAGQTIGDKLQSGLRSLIGGKKTSKLLKERDDLVAERAKLLSEKDTFGKVRKMDDESLKWNRERIGRIESKIDRIERNENVAKTDRMTNSVATGLEALYLKALMAPAEAGANAFKYVARYLVPNLKGE